MDVVGNDDLKLRALGDRAGGCFLEVLGEVRRRHMAQGAQPHLDRGDGLGLFAPGDLFDLLHQVLHQRGFVHG